MPSLKMHSHFKFASVCSGKFLSMNNDNDDDFIVDQFVDSLKSLFGGNLSAPPINKHDDSSDLSDLEPSSFSSSSSDDEQEEQNITTAENVLKRHQHIQEVGERYLESFPDRPEKQDRVNRLMFLYYYAIQFVILYHKYDGEVPKPDFNEDSDDKIREKAHIVYLHRSFTDFIEMMKEISQHILVNIITEKSIKHLGGETEFNKHPIKDVLEYVCLHKEMHSRRSKLNPATNRVKADNLQIAKNSITCEIYDSDKNSDHHLWRMLIFTPLHSDYNRHAIDMSENMYQVNAPEIPEPFIVVVTPDWDKLLRMLHMCVHFQEYLYTYINTALSEEDLNKIKELNCEQTWLYLTEDFGKFMPNVKDKIVNPIVATLDKFSRQKKDVSPLIFRIGVLRDFLRVVAKF